LQEAVPEKASKPAKPEKAAAAAKKKKVNLYIVRMRQYKTNFKLRSNTVFHRRRPRLKRLPSLRQRRHPLKTRTQRLKSFKLKQSLLKKSPRSQSRLKVILTLTYEGAKTLPFF